MTEQIYFESHITIEPVFDNDLEKFKNICSDYKFHVATLLLQKRKEDSAERSKNDSFCTGRGSELNDLKNRMLNLVQHLIKENFVVWRYKIESVLIDSRYDDSKFPLNKSTLPKKERANKSPI